MVEKINNILSPQCTMFGTPLCTNLDELSADIAFLGVPWEQGQVSFEYTGQKWAPSALRWSSRVVPYSGSGWGDIVKDEGAQGYWDMDAGEWRLRGVTMVDCGDVNILPAGGERDGVLGAVENCERITEVVKKILDRGAFPVSLGGDHSIPTPIVRAFDKYDPLDIVHFDAHHDFRDAFGGIKITNADFARRLSEFPFVHNITQIGLRAWRLTPSSKQAYDAYKEYGQVITANKFREMGVDKVVESIPKGNNIYVTIDTDALDPSIAPACSGVEPGGLSYLDVQQTLIGIAKRGRVVGMDVVCFLPAHDPSQVTARTLVYLILDLLAAVFPSKA